MIPQTGDDLGDDFLADDLVSLSEEEVDLEDDLDDAHNEPESSAMAATSPGEKKRKRREKEKLKKIKRRKTAEAVEKVEISVAMQNQHDLSKYLVSQQAKSFKDLSQFELDDMRIADIAIADTTMWSGPRTLLELPTFIMKVLPSLHLRLSQKSKYTGAPTLIFITGESLRVADAARVLKDKRLRGEKGCEVAKLFSRHFKLSEHVSYLKRTKIGAAAGTPGRVGKLLCETDALSISALTHIILDVTFKDSKKRSLLDMPETRDEVFKTVLGCPSVLQAIKSGKIQVVLF